MPDARRRVLARGVVGATAVGLGGVAQVCPPIAALLLMDARQFGEFSLLYLLFAWGLSLQLSICTEPYVRHRLAHGHSATEARHLRSTSTALAAVAGLIVAAMAAVLWSSWMLATVSGLAVFATVVRNGARFQSVTERGLRTTVLGDAILVLVFGVVLFLLLGRGDDLTAVLGAWGAAGVATLVVSPPATPAPRIVRAWVAEHGASIRPLLRESLVLDISSIGGAYLLAPVLALRDFGVYRAVSNVATPVRLAAEGLRPLAGRTLAPRTQRRLTLALIGTGVLAGLAAGLAIVAVDRFDIDLGVVNDLAPYAAPTGVFVGASLIGAVLYYRARIYATSQQLWHGRLWQSGTALVGPLVGGLAAGLDGAITGTALATAAGAVVWWRLARAHAAEPVSSH